MMFLFGPRPSWNQDNNIWKKADVLLAEPDFGQEFRLAIEATVAEGQHGDIAIDDVTFTPGCVIKEDTSTTSTTTAEHNNPDVEFECDFEKDQCGWVEGTTNEAYKWERISNDECKEQHEDCPDPFEPDSNHYFMYVDGSKGTENDNTELMSPDNKDQGDCLMFEFNFRVSFLFLERSFVDLYLF